MSHLMYSLVSVFWSKSFSKLFHSARDTLIVISGMMLLSQRYESPACPMFAVVKAPEMIGFGPELLSESFVLLSGEVCSVLSVLSSGAIESRYSQPLMNISPSSIVESLFIFIINLGKSTQMRLLHKFYCYLCRRLVGKFR